MRRTVIILAAGLAIAAGAGQPASTAELPVKAPIYAPQLFSWTGCYVGLHLGGAWGSKDWTLNGAGTPISSYGQSGIVGGGQVGCDYQTGVIVLGAQFDYGWSSLRGSGPDQIAIGFTEHTKTDSIATVTGRLGLAWDRWLTFIRGGAAWAHDDHDIVATATGVLAASQSETRNGWTVGIGGEYALTNNLSGFVEYNYYDFGTSTLPFAGFGTADIKQNISVVKGGLNYRFNWLNPLATRN